MKRFLLIALAVALWTSVSQAQVQRCHTDEYLEELKKSDAQLESRIQKTKDQARQFLNDPASQKKGRGVLITIPVVVHVMHHGEAVGTGTNISDAQVFSQIAVLNEDYQGLNADLTDVPAHFSTVVGNPEIEFCLAQFDPEGAPTNGIHRVNMGSGSWSDNRKPGTIWSSNQYLNIWVTEISGGILGYATYPGTSPSQDGVVIDYRYFGKTPHNSFISRFNLGRTTTHEIGHWLNLDHTFSGSCSGGSQTNCNSQGDRICDTPPTADPNYGCSLSATRNTCQETPVDQPDMWMNYMDYMDDACLFMFTQEQVDVMRAVLNTSRSGILLSPACNNQNLFSYSGKVVDAVSGAGVPNAKVLFQGALHYEITADANGNFSSPSFREDNYAIYAGKWGYATKEFSSSTLITSGSPALTIPIDPGFYYDDFLMDYGWTISGSATTGMWERGEPVETNYNGIVSNPGADIAGDYGDQCYVTGNGGGSAGNDDVDDGDAVLKSPLFDLTAYGDPCINYYRWFFNDGGQGNPNDVLTISIFNGTETKVIETIDASVLNSNQWNFINVKVKDLITPTSSMQFIVATADQGSGHLVEAGLDKFQVVDSLATSAIQILTRSNIFIYPNPSSDILNVRIEAYDIESARVVFSDISGKHLKKLTFGEENLLHLDVSNIPSGTYFLQIENPKGKMVQKVSIFH